MDTQPASTDSSKPRRLSRQSFFSSTAAAALRSLGGSGAAMLDALDTEEALAAPADSDPRWSNDHPVLRELARAHESARVNALRAGALRGVRL